MVLTQKETMLLNDLKTQEQLCIDKYERYAADACDPALGTLFWDLLKVERGHLDTIDKILQGKDVRAGGDPQQNAAQNAEKNTEQNDFKAHAAYTAMSEGEDKCSDAYLCQDALSGEKHVSGVYDTVIFECTQKALRDVLNHIQKEEQGHGKRIYDYMAANGMYS